MKIQIALIVLVYIAGCLEKKHWKPKNEQKQFQHVVQKNYKIIDNKKSMADIKKKIVSDDKKADRFNKKISKK